MPNNIPTYLYVIASMRATFERRVATHGEYPTQPAPPALPEAYKRALEAQSATKIAAKHSTIKE